MHINPLFRNIQISIGVLVLALSATTAARAQDITVGHTGLTEESILGHMAVQLLESEGLDIDHVANLGGTGLAFESLKEGQIDIYPGYTGDALANVLDKEPVASAREAYELVKNGMEARFDITALEPTPFNNTYAIAIPEQVANEHDIETISDLEPFADEWVIGSSVEFAGRPLDGYPGMIKHYGFEFQDIKPMDVGLMYSAIDSDEVDAIVAFATDARIDLVNLKVLEDDKEFFPAYNATMLVREEILERYPEIEEPLNALTTSLEGETMIGLNGRVDIDNEDPEAVARDYLEQEGFL